ncbi:RNA polymerase sigma factor, sigma-70 family [Cryptosporangium arvum DSM 44712]|uniref:RNA polymerase sigma factor, sigma-70 family n=1 Tax=Cryptosporangium arvum DSM 44712 TaxID=927661 RepID=A0A010ZZR3_9ACTN|nr:sigma-70 family RNA polymerase sigma factor [Cryptosporangium arvum]EXG82717.1 RNA polymerase sigma factor, sigma-70 family [Cryptosporangium arvum DSM 44712]
MSGPLGYAHRTMVNVFLHRCRRAADLPVEHVPDAGRDDDAPAAVDSAAATRQVLAGLPPTQRAAIALRYFADLPDEEIGRLLGCTPRTVRSQVSRGLAALRRRWAAER